MQILNIDPQNPNQTIIKQAVDCLKNGGVIVYPTDTCYGIGADFHHLPAIKKIYTAKGRRFNKPLSIIVKNLEQLKTIAAISKTQEKILENNLPGQFTFIVDRNEDFKAPGALTIGIRIPDYKITQMITDEFDKPYTTTSANISGQPECYSIEKLMEQFKNQKNKPDLVLDAGPLIKKLPSTVVDLTQTPPAVLRQGSANFR